LYFLIKVYLVSLILRCYSSNIGAFLGEVWRGVEVSKERDPITN
jgi:hypothetical protein